MSNIMPVNYQIMSTEQERAPMLTPLSLDLLKTAAKAYAAELSSTGIPSLYGVTDGKAVGTYVEAGFNEFIARSYSHTPGNAARGIDFPELNVDLKVTSIRQPQSSCPFRNATQKIYGLGYHLLVMVYEKSDDHTLQEAKLNFLHVLFIDDANTADFQMTTGLRRIIDQNGSADDIDAHLEDKNLPLDPESRRQLAEKILTEPPSIGGLTISNALQWRLQYSRAIGIAQQGNIEGISDLIG